MNLEREPYKRELFRLLRLLASDLWVTAGGEVTGWGGSVLPQELAKEALVHYRSIFYGDDETEAQPMSLSRKILQRDLFAFLETSQPAHWWKDARYGWKEAPNLTPAQEAEALAAWRYHMADAMLKERGERLYTRSEVLLLGVDETELEAL